MAVRSIAALAALLVALTGIGTAAARPSATHTTRVMVKAKDFSFQLSTSTVRRGRVKFVITNRGHTSHDFAIAGHTSKTIQPGKTTSLTVTLKKRGRYPYKCSVDSHAKLGMKGVLRVR
jgi:plastocyanin